MPSKKQPRDGLCGQRDYQWELWLPSPALIEILELLAMRRAVQNTEVHLRMHRSGIEREWGLSNSTASWPEVLMDGEGVV